MYLLRRYRSLLPYVFVSVFALGIIFSVYVSKSENDIRKLDGFNADPIENSQPGTPEAVEEKPNDDADVKTYALENAPDPYAYQSNVEKYIEKQLNSEGSEIKDISKMTDEEIREKLRIIKHEQEEKRKKSQEVVDFTDPADRVEGTMIDNNSKTRLDPPPDGQPWAQYELERKVPDGLVGNGGLVNATLFTLCRNSELYSILDSIHQLETRFNGKHHYDWVFLNDEPFSEEFIELTSNLISGRARYGLIPKKHWTYPEYVDQDKAREIRESRKWAQITYGSSESYRHMCRFNSLFFYKHPIMEEYDYYWRVEPDVKFHCDIMQDPFKYFLENKKKYGFTISMRELPNTIETLWDTSKLYFGQLQEDYFSKENRERNLADFITDDSGASYNLCHYWTNFEIADLSIYRNEIYQGYVEHLDRAGGFFYERWGDAPIHSIIFSLMLSKKEIHLFQDISYEHTVGKSCPLNRELHRKAQCICDPEDNWVLTSDSSCNLKFLDVVEDAKPPELEAYLQRIANKKLEEEELRQEQRKLRMETARRSSEARRRKAEERRKARIAAKEAHRNKQKEQQ